MKPRQRSFGFIYLEDVWELLWDLKQGNDKIKVVSVEKLVMDLGKGVKTGIREVAIIKNASEGQI